MVLCRVMSMKPLSMEPVVGALATTECLERMFFRDASGSGLLSSHVAMAPNLKPNFA